MKRKPLSPAASPKPAQEDARRQNKPSKYHADAAVDNAEEPKLEESVPVVSLEADSAKMQQIDENDIFGLFSKNSLQAPSTSSTSAGEKTVDLFTDGGWGDIFGSGVNG